MKCLVVYDSVYGNTQKIAEAIGKGIGGSVKVLRAGEVGAPDLESVDLLIVGAPTQAGRPTPPVQAFLSRVPEKVIRNARLASFDTRFSTKWVGIFGYAAGRIAETFKDKGGNLIAPPEAFFVKGIKGPLAEGEMEGATAWAKKLIEP